ncbi:nucleoporin SEH1-like, partial [Cryptotermes secundus]|uniref:nucleoporin SEH1-like n=1 Tax=Cryptotermes secundus TaxID=105785 RepID=UPI001454D44C
MLAVGSDDPNTANGGKVFIYEFSENSRRWSKTETLVGVTEAVHDIAFAPNLGRSYHLLAIATSNVRIITLKPLQDSTLQSGLTRFDVQMVAQFEEHHSTVWRVCWNITGTILASSGDDGFVRLWKANYMNNWKCVAVLKGDGTQAQSDSSVPAVPAPSGGVASSNQSSTTRTSEETSSKWQAPVIKGRFQKMTWLGSDPPPPPTEKSKP